MSLGPLVLTKLQAQRLVKEIVSDAKGLASKLRELRDRLGWKALDYDSWAVCVKEEFGYSKDWANKQIAALKVRGRVNTTVSTPSPDGGAMPDVRGQVGTMVPSKPSRTGLRRRICTIPAPVLCIFFGVNQSETVCWEPWFPLAPSHLALPRHRVMGWIPWYSPSPSLSGQRSACWPSPSSTRILP